MSTEKLTSHVSLIWNIAEILRGDYKEHEYGDVVLPFTVLTRLDSVLIETKQAVLDIKATSMPKQIEELQYAKAAGYPFWNTSNFTLKTLLDDADNLEQNLSYYVQAIARDLLTHGMRQVTNAGHRIVMHVHDEIVVETTTATVDEICTLMASAPDWVDRLPLSADGYACDFYRKD
ncbi:type I restriction-modification system subunit M N-terminal domain-containing protein [Arcanobacterium hippocoleae]|uniref:type I restriction-modification system subunit M N-terminal domain-containing protein n=1 Tax=Arcanobacterium hippocoleae TaxID=149017 RepID=UPI003341626F